ncbi:MAG: DMT family transporter [Synergistaceae bacterium]|nr:DMT family transporter [Synergistaceae bacterium]
MDAMGLTYCLLTTVFWALSPIFLRKSQDTFDNVEINATRCLGFFSVAAIACLVTNPSLILWKYELHVLGIVFGMVILGNLIGDLCYMIAIDNIGVGRALSTSNSYPIFVSIFSMFVVGETPSMKLWIGTIIIIIGLACLNLPKKSSLPSTGKIRSNSLGFTLAILTALLWGSMITIQKWLVNTHNIEPLTFTFWRAVSLSIVAWSYWYIRKNREEKKHIFNVGFGKWVSPFIAGACGLALGGITIMCALLTVPVSIVAPITASNPVIAAIIARFAFKEKLSLIQWVGIVLVIIGGIEVSSSL